MNKKFLSSIIFFTIFSFVHIQLFIASDSPGLETSPKTPKPKKEAPSPEEIETQRAIKKAKQAKTAETTGIKRRIPIETQSQKKLLQILLSHEKLYNLYMHYKVQLKILLQNIDSLLAHYKLMDSINILNLTNTTRTTIIDQIKEFNIHFVRLDQNMTNKLNKIDQIIKNLNLENILSIRTYIINDLAPEKNEMDTKIAHLKRILLMLTSYENIMTSPPKSAANDTILAPNYSFLNCDPFDSAIRELLRDGDKQLTPIGIAYINAAYQISLYMLYNNIFQLLPKQISFNSETFEIQSWNLLHILLGSFYESNFSGLHFKNDRIFNKLYDFYIKITDNSRIENGFVFYKQHKLRKLNIKYPDQYFIKRCSFFKTNTIEETIDCILNASKNIINKKIVKNLENFIGYDDQTQQSIEIWYDVYKKLITTCFPTFNSFYVYEGEISAENFNEFKKQVATMADTEKTYENIRNVLARYNTKVTLTTDPLLIAAKAVNTAQPAATVPFLENESAVTLVTKEKEQQPIINPSWENDLTLFLQGIINRVDPIMKPHYLDIPIESFIQEIKKLFESNFEYQATTAPPAYARESSDSSAKSTPSDEPKTEARREQAPTTESVTPIQFGKSLSDSTIFDKDTTPIHPHAAPDAAS